MGFFKRLLSVRSRKSKKRSSAKEDARDLRQFRSQTLPPLLEVESEVTANRLLRSASSRLGAIHHSVNDDSLPPLPNPHPELDEEAETRSLPFLPNPHPFISSAEVNTLASFSPRCSVIDMCPTPEVKHEPAPPPRMTYVVKVHERTVISRTEFPNAIPSLVTPTKQRPKSAPLPPTIDLDTSDDESISPSTAKRPAITPRDQNRLLRLRQDPSVVSLLNIYDSHGRLDNNVFSNSPLKDDQNDEEQVYTVGRPQHQRRVSTLRQLMGEPELEGQPNISRSEGEISWAERLLQERNASSISLTTVSSSAGAQTPQDINFGQSQSYEDEHTTRQDYDSYQRQESVVSSTEMEASAKQPITNITTTALMETYPQTPGKASEVFEFLTERRKQQESRPLPPNPAFNSRPSSFSGSPSLPQEDLSPESPEYIHVSQELSPVSRIPRFNGDESSTFDSTTSPTPIFGDSRIPRRIDSWRPNAPFNDKLLRDTVRLDQEDRDPFTAIPFREHRRKLSYSDADKALIMSPDPVRDFGNDVSNRRSPIPFHRKALSAHGNQENDWSVQGLTPTTPKRSRTVAELHSAGGCLMPVSPANSAEMSPLGQQIMANVRRKRYGH